jgi:hypothetical protein
VAAAKRYDRTELADTMFAALQTLKRQMGDARADT